MEPALASRRRVRLRKAAFALVAVAGLGAALAVASGAGAVNRALDRRALRMMAGVAARGARVEAPLPYTTLAELEAITRPHRLAPEARPLTRHRRSEAHLVQEELSFTSAVRTRHAVSNRAVAYVYRHGPLGARPIVLWVPGQYVIDLAFVPIGWFLDELLGRGVDVVVYVPPYHLERTPAGFESGDAVLATDLGDQLAAFAQEISDLRSLSAWLRERGPPALGAFGGSFGGVALLRVVGWDARLDFLTVMMPPVRLDRMLLEAPEAEAARRRFVREGRAPGEVAALYRLLDPTSTPPRLRPQCISAIYGRHDLVAPADALGAWANAWGVTRLRVIERGHVLMLFSPALYRAYADLIDHDLGHCRPGAAGPAPGQE